MQRHILPVGFAFFFVGLVCLALVLAVGDYLAEREGSVVVVMGAVEETAVLPTTESPSPLPRLAPESTATIARTAVATPLSDPTPLPPEPTSHVVQPGETLFRIATRYGLTVADLAAANNLTDPSRIVVGQTLTLPQQQPTTNNQQSTINNPPPATGNQPPATSHQQPATSNQPPTTLNNLPLDAIVVMPESVRQNVQAIYAAGQSLGRNPRAFAKVGDSTIHPDHFLSRFDSGPYNLGEYAYLQDTIEQYRGSFGRHSVAVRIGLHAWTVFDPIYANKSICLPDEHVLACEFRLHNPAIVLVRLGSNDIGAPSLYESNMRQIVQFSIENGVIPVLGTKADRREGSNQNNDILRQIAADYQIPLWEFDIVAGTLPGRGLDVDGVHMNTFYAHDYTQPVAFQRGHAMHNLSALMVLDAIWRLTIDNWRLTIDN